MIKERLEEIRAEALKRIGESPNLDILNQARVEILGKKGELTQVLKGMKDVAASDRPKVGQMVNDTREEIEKALRYPYFLLFLPP